MQSPDAAAKAVGLRVGTPTTSAQVFAPDLILHEADPGADDEVLTPRSVDRLRYALHRLIASALRTL